MKINVPTIQRTEIGYRLKSIPVYETALTTKTIFDYDFKLKRRLLAVAATTALLGIVVLTPFVIAGGTLIDLAKTAWREANDAAVLIWYSLARTFEGLSITTRAIFRP